MKQGQSQNALLKNTLLLTEELSEPTLHTFKPLGYQNMTTTF